MSDAQKYGRRNVPKMHAQVNILRSAIRAEGTPMIQQAWDAVEEHIDFAYSGAMHRAGYELARAEAAEVGWHLRAYDVVMRGKG